MSSNGFLSPASWTGAAMTEHPIPVACLVFEWARQQLFNEPLEAEDPEAGDGDDSPKVRSTALL